jgi:hypothetical protein
MNPTMIKTTLSLTLLLAASACAAPPAAPLRVFKATGSLQCGDGGTPLPVMARQLGDAGVTVITSSCGRDGRMHPAVCGAADGRIGIFDIAAADAAAAAKLGFLPLTQLSEAKPAPCP